MTHLLAVSDLHMGYGANRELVDELRPTSSTDWLIVAGDVGEVAEVVVATLAQLAGRFERVIWAPGNHELWTHPRDPLTLRGEERYRHLVERCQDIGVLTPEDDFAIWTGSDGPVTIAPLFAFYDYTFLPPDAPTRESALALAYRTGVVCTDEKFLQPDPYVDRADWCHARVSYSEQRLAECDPEVPTVLVNHWPLTREPTKVLRFPQFAQWCGTELTADWHTKYHAAAVVYGHLHIPRTTFEDGVRFEEVSLGYPREWRRWQERGHELRWPRVIL